MFKKIFIPFIFVTLLKTAFAQEISITIDDAPREDGQYFKGEQRTQTLIRKLKESGVEKATFFIIGNHITAKTQERVALYDKAGHTIANHSFFHKSLHQMDASKYVADIEKAHDVLKNYTNFKKWFRFPMLHEGNTKEKRDYVRTALKRLDYKSGYVTVDNYDWYMDRLFQDALRAKRKVDYAKLEKVYIDVMWEQIQFFENIAQKTLKRSPKHVLLLHENDLTTLYLNKLIERIKKQGWKIISPEDAYTDPIADIEPDTLALGQGRVGAIARTLGYKEPISNRWEDEVELDKLFTEENVFY